MLRLCVLFFLTCEFSIQDVITETYSISYRLKSDFFLGIDVMFKKLQYMRKAYCTFFLLNKSKMLSSK